MQTRSRFLRPSLPWILLSVEASGCLVALSGCNAVLGNGDPELNLGLGSAASGGQNGQTGGASAIGGRAQATGGNGGTQAQPGGSNSIGGTGTGTAGATPSVGGRSQSGGNSNSAGATATGGTNSATTGTGGATGAGGVAGTGGTVVTAGAPGAGGTLVTAGAPGTGGLSATGGAPSAGGSFAVGGNASGGVATGGRVATGGAKPTGGAPPATGGTPPTGGAPATGGAPPDTTPPTVATSTPTGTGVAPNTTVKATFSEPINCSSVTATSFAVAGGSSVSAPVSGTLACSGATVTFTPQIPFLLNANYSVNLTGLIKDLAGNALANAPYTWSFTVRDGTWGTGQYIENTTAAGDGLFDLAVDPSGNALVAWTRSDGTNSSMWSSRYVAATGTWGGQVAVNSAAGQNADSPSMGVDASGNFQVIWGQAPGGYMPTYTVWSNRYVAGIGWNATPSPVRTTNTISADSYSFAVGSDGNSYCLWRESNSSGQSTWGSHFSATAGTWSAAQQLDPTGGGGAVTVTSTGTAVATYLTAAGRVNSAVAPPGQNFGTPTAMETYLYHSGVSMSPSIRADGNGRAMAVWKRQSTTDTNYLIWYNQWSGTGWGANEAQIDDVTPYAVNPPDIATNAGGIAVAVWATADSTYDIGGVSINVLATGQFYWPSNGIGGPTTGGSGVSTYAAFAGTYPKVAIDAAGNFIVVWAEVDGGVGTVWTFRYTGGAFSAKTQLSLAGSNADSPRIVMDGSGNALVVWRQFDGTRTRLYATWFR